eukprot:CAMPEP_0181320186 /NCGR_PEP_ID=MMETSP1101-20121128/17984_1 /TAXON_ID=46948 /ORGANISM="Rhodomonas abbreviata, Strain Caron Lab Isolate" /LENGTH=396 /DNA_ID=CAMNT_0023427863 /DNA_START=16 /DNA_END=1203 /DNA_ORIENTATION=-
MDTAGGVGRESQLSRSSESPVVLAHELVCRADDCYRDGDFISAARFYRQAADRFEAAAQTTTGSLDEHSLDSLLLLAASHRRKAARLEKMTGQDNHTEDNSPASTRKSPHGRFAKAGAGGGGMGLACPSRSASFFALEQSMQAPPPLPPWTRFIHACCRLLDDLASSAGIAESDWLDESIMDEGLPHSGREARDGKLAHNGRLGRLQQRRDRDDMMGSVCLVASSSVMTSPPSSRNTHLHSRHPAPDAIARGEGSSKHTAIEENHPLLCTVELEDDAEERERATAALTNPRSRQSGLDAGGSDAGSGAGGGGDALKNMSRQQLEEALRRVQQGVEDFASGFAAEAKAAAGDMALHQNLLMSSSQHGAPLLPPYSPTVHQPPSGARTVSRQLSVQLE